MLANEVFEVMLKKDLPTGTKVIDSAWVMKKKNSGMLHGQMHAKGFKQIEGQHYDGTSICLPVTNTAMIRIVLTLIVFGKHDSTCYRCQRSILAWRA